MSFPYYMSEEDFEFVLTAIEFVANYGQRFLPLYSFNLRNGSWRLKTEELEELSKEDNCNFHFRLLKKVETTRRNASYLDAAKIIACSLPKFPPRSILPGNIDPNVLYFRV